MDATIEYTHADERLPQEIRDCASRKGIHATVIAPLSIGNRTLGWIKLSASGEPDCASTQWWRVMLTQAIARQAALALHLSRVDREQPASRSGARRFSKNATGWRATSTTTSRRASPRS